MNFTRNYQKGWSNIKEFKNTLLTCKTLKYLFLVLVAVFFWNIVHESGYVIYAASNAGEKSLAADVEDFIGPRMKKDLKEEKADSLTSVLTPTPTPSPTPTPTPTPTPAVIKGAEEYYKEEVEDYCSKPGVLSDTPNIILIFTEGLSQNIIDDERGIMPNVAEFQAESINFVNYFNHSFATYRGIQGQLYSGYQINDTDQNQLISIQEILSDHGYSTVMINTEPKNETFSEYLDHLGFDDVITDSLQNIEKTSTQSDKSSYELLLKTALELEEEEEPFFLTIYTIGTHAYFDSPDKLFGDGSSNVLNRFYNTDYQFGEFFEEFKNSALADDTILVFTSDHATFAEEDFSEAFPDYVRDCSDVDRIPLSIYCKGMRKGNIDADGRNSLDLAPTILDFIDISGRNYFLGNSLFSEKPRTLTVETVFFDPTFWICSNGNGVARLDGEDRERIIQEVSRYCAVSVKN